MPIVSLKKATKERDIITKDILIKIKRMYERAGDELAYSSKKYEGRNNISSILMRQYNKEMVQILEIELKHISKELEKSTVRAMMETSLSVARSTEDIWSKLGFPIEGRIQYIPRDIVVKLIKGDIYEQGWSLSKRIWGIEQKALSDIYTIVSKGVTLNKSTFEIAKDLERYVRPSVRKDWGWSKVYPNTNKMVDYNAQRLARTLVQHSFQLSIEESSNKNPFVEGFIWDSAMIEGRTCQICMDRDGQFFEKGEVPLDHPNGLCTIHPYVKDLKEVADQLADWVKQPSGTYPEIDEYDEYLNRKNGAK